jgi:hypothetical protein
MATFFQVVARGLEGPMSEGTIASFGSLWEAERALMNARYKDISVDYWIVVRNAQNQDISVDYWQAPHE